MWKSIIAEIVLIGLGLLSIFVLFGLPFGIAGLMLYISFLIGNFSLGAFLAGSVGEGIIQGVFAIAFAVTAIAMFIIHSKGTLEEFRH